MPFDQTNYQPESIGRQRLRILADFLPSVPKERFDMSDWAQQPDFERCGTAACACGWATAIPEFRAAGLDLGYKGSGKIGTAPIKFDGMRNWQAIRAFFGIERETSHHLFNRSAYTGDTSPTPADVAARIREHLAQTASAPTK